MWVKVRGVVGLQGVTLDNSRDPFSAQIVYQQQRGPSPQLQSPCSPLAQASSPVPVVVSTYLTLFQMCSQNHLNLQVVCKSRQSLKWPISNRDHESPQKIMYLTTCIYIKVPKISIQNQVQLVQTSNCSEFCWHRSLLSINSKSSSCEHWKKIRYCDQQLTQNQAPVDARRQLWSSVDLKSSSHRLQ